MIHSSDWLLRRDEDGKYVSKPGSENSYTKSPLRAAVSDSRSGACGCVR